ncbi:hypothetical protein FACS1894219_04190 [Clostridia bacterium]|nr:hypothetical protein FACS1894219_04190 [Clostridia bacterium]
MILLLILSITPTILIILFIMSKDKYEPEPRALLFKLFGLGVLTIIPSVIFEMVFELPVGQDLLTTAIYAFCVVAFSEEGSKFIAVRLFAYNKPSFNEIYDGIIYSVFVSLGFATAENIFYVFANGVGTGILRAVTSVPGHTMFAVAMGYYLSLSKVRGRKGYDTFMAILTPVLLHGLYDFLLMSGNGILILLFIPYLIFLYVRTVKMIKKTSVLEPFAPPSVPAAYNGQIPQQPAVYPAPEQPPAAASAAFCPECGAAVTTGADFCGDCGSRLQ